MAYRVITRTRAVRRAVLVSVLSLALLLGGCAQVSVEPSPSGKPTIGYAEGTVAVEDPEALQQAVDDMEEKAKEPGVGLEYKNDATSTDGVNFDCYIANSANNTNDMFIAIYADAELTDEIFLSQLLRPGTAFDTIKLSKPLEKGAHRVYVAFTQVEEDLLTVHAQVLVTMDFTVS